MDRYQQLRDEIQSVSWDALEPHYRRGALIIVSRHLDLADVAIKVADDDVPAITAWLATGMLYKPTPAMVERWSGQPDALHAFLIAQPYVLCHEQVVPPLQ